MSKTGSGPRPRLPRPREAAPRVVEGESIS